MKIKLVDHKSDTYETEFGTCELCMFTGLATETSLKFQYEDGYTEWVDAFEWSWGDLFEVYIDNLADFAHWLQQQDFPDDFRIDYGKLQNLNYDYEDYLEKENH